MADPEVAIGVRGELLLVLGGEVSLPLLELMEVIGTIGVGVIAGICVVDVDTNAVSDVDVDENTVSDAGADAGADVDVASGERGIAAFL